MLASTAGCTYRCQQAHACMISVTEAQLAVQVCSCQNCSHGTRAYACMTLCMLMLTCAKVALGSACLA